MELKNVLYEKKEQIAYVTINRPETLNALNCDVLNELIYLMKNVNADAEVRVVILTGAGRSFVAGADISQMRGLTTEEGRDMTRLGQECMALIEKTSKPVIAAVNGFALGGGCELAMSCDFIIASEKAKFSQPEVNLGIIPGFGGTQRLPRLVGKNMAKYMIMTGEMLNAQQAYEAGIVQKVVPAEELLDAATAVANTILSKAPIAIRMAKLAVNNGFNMDLTSAIEYEAEAYTVSFASEDRGEGMSAFVEKRQADFKGK
ncbi:MAG: enoyl-CoA hydratase/isomerase family protein [Clostridia bacterium]|nr:enoyl-CoA hydratase/isomerase family protein [Clostridia bacterium]